MNLRFKGWILQARPVELPRDAAGPAGLTQPGGRGGGGGGGAGRAQPRQTIAGRTREKRRGEWRSGGPALPFYSL
jgi:hypothetical protein